MTVAKLSSMMYASMMYAAEMYASMMMTMTISLQLCRKSTGRIVLVDIIKLPVS